MKKVYHFCCQYHEGGGRVNYYDGILTTSNDLTKENAYTELKRELAKGMASKPEDPKQIIITSLALVG